MQLEQTAEIRLVLDDQDLVTVAFGAPRKFAAALAQQFFDRRQQDPAVAASVFQARSTPASDHNCTVRSDTPRRSAASRVEQTSCSACSDRPPATPAVSCSRRPS